MKNTLQKEQYGDHLLELHGAQDIWDVLCCCQKNPVFWDRYQTLMSKMFSALFYLMYN